MYNGFDQNQFSDQQGFYRELQAEGNVSTSEYIVKFALMDANQKLNLRDGHMQGDGVPEFIGCFINESNGFNCETGQNTKSAKSVA